MHDTQLYKLSRFHPNYSYDPMIRVSVLLSNFRFFQYVIGVCPFILEFRVPVQKKIPHDFVRESCFDDAGFRDVECPPIKNMGNVGEKEWTPPEFFLLSIVLDCLVG